MPTDDDVDAVDLQAVSEIEEADVVAARDTAGNGDLDGTDPGNLALFLLIF